MLITWRCCLPVPPCNSGKFSLNGFPSPTLYRPFQFTPETQEPWGIPDMSCSGPRWQRPKPPRLLVPGDWGARDYGVGRMWGWTTLYTSSASPQPTEQRERGLFQTTVKPTWIMLDLSICPVPSVMETPLHQTGWRSKTTTRNSENERGPGEICGWAARAYACFCLFTLFGHV